MMRVCHTVSRCTPGGGSIQGVACRAAYEVGNVLAAEQSFQEILTLLLEI